MTEDQLKLYVDYISTNGYVAEVIEEKIKINVNIEGLDLVIWCYLSRFFPYEIPEISIDEESGKKLPKMPHMLTNNRICVFDEGKVIPNINNPKQLVLDTIEAAIAVIQEGITKRNHQDYMDEFVEYWKPKGLFEAEVFIDNLTTNKSIYWCFKNKKMIIAENVTRLQEISVAIDGKEIESKNIQKGLLIPINGSNMSSIPKTDLDIIDIVVNNSIYNKQYNSFMQSNIDKGSLIVFNFVVPEGEFLAGWVHWGPGVPEGFRRGHVNLKVAFKMSKKNGIAVSVTNCHQNRLFTRGGDGREVIWKKAAIIGCGSIGSLVADALKMYGTEHFVLVDNESLQYENIARHYCGYFNVDSAKVNAVGLNLQLHNPNITYIPRIKNAHEVMEDEAELLNECDVIFVAVASVTVEHHINRLILEDKIAKPVMMVWVEPYMIGGHAILIKKKQDLYRDIFDKNTLEYNHSIVKNSIDYLKREAGCQSTYMPYSGFVLQQFIYGVLERILSYYWKHKGNYLLTWCGKLSDAEKLGMELNDVYKNADEYTIVSKRID